MSKREQALRIEPKNEIHFKGPYNRVVTEYFHLSNPTEKNIAFKVKTTAPKRYCVRPNNGILLPGKSINVAVMLQPLATGDQAVAAAAIEKNKHKFMIQSVFAGNGDANSNADDLFKSVSPDDIMDSKFRCVFDDTASSTTTAVSSSAANNGHQVVNSGKLGTAGSDSDNEINADQKYHGESGDLSSFGSISNDHHGIGGSDITSASSTAYTLAANEAGSTSTNNSSQLTNGGDDGELLTSSSRGGFSNASSTAATTVVESGGSSISEVKRLLEENHQLRIKLNDLERAARSSAVNRFATSGSAAASSSPAKPNATTQPPSLLDQPLSGQLILTVLISLLIGFILGKIDLGLF